MKTIAQIAGELGVSKQRVYRYIKREHISEVHQRNGVMYYDEAAENLIKKGFIENGTSDDVHHDAHQSVSDDAPDDAVTVSAKYLAHLENEVAFLRGELSLTREALRAGQALHAGTLKQIAPELPQEDKQEIIITPSPDGKRMSFISRIFGRR